MTRSEYITWAKQRALETLNKGNLVAAFTSMHFDMLKREDTNDPSLANLGITQLASGDLSTHEQMKNWIEGFN